MARRYSAEVRIYIVTGRVEFGVTMVGIYKSLKFNVHVEHFNTARNSEPTVVDFCVMEILKNGNMDKGKGEINYYLKYPPPLLCISSRNFLLVLTLFEFESPVCG